MPQTSRPDWYQIEQDYVEGLTDPATKQHYYPTIRQLSILYGVPESSIKRHSGAKAWAIKRQNYQERRTEMVRKQREEKYFQDLYDMDFGILQLAKGLFEIAKNKVYLVNRGPDGQPIGVSINQDMAVIDIKRCMEVLETAGNVADRLRKANHVQAEDSFDKLLAIIQADRAAGKHDEPEEDNLDEDEGDLYQPAQAGPIQYPPPTTPTTRSLSTKPRVGLH